MTSPPLRQHTLLGLLSIICLGCNTNSQLPVLRLATTTTTRDSGLLDQLLPRFETLHQTRVKVIAAGTGKVLKLGQQGEVDVILVHAREAEQAFLAAGHGTRREDVMVNTFNLLGPPDDPAGIRGKDTPTALQRIAKTGATFLSRGDDSGTHKRELKLWQSNGTRPNWPNYRESGQGMGRTLTIANQMSAYVLTDRGTYLHFRDKINLIPLATDTPELHNHYGILVVNDNKSPSIRPSLANTFVDFMISPETQQIIADYQVNGEPLFKPMRLPPAD